MMIGRLKIEAKRWPWQKGYNWYGMTNSSAPLSLPREGEKAAPRFGGGWKYELGIHIGSRSINLMLLYGMITIQFFKYSKCPGCGGKVGTHHSESCPKFRKSWAADHWMNKITGY